MTKPSPRRRNCRLRGTTSTPNPAVNNSHVKTPNALQRAIDKQLHKVQEATGVDVGGIAGDMTQAARSKPAPCPPQAASPKTAQSIPILHLPTGVITTWLCNPIVTSTEPSITLPEGHRAKVAQIPLRVLGRAAALSDGRTADGCIDMEVLAEAAHKKIKLAQHSAYRLRAATLEPVARPGDMLLVKEAGEPSVKSLVIALSESRVLARRFELAENHPDIAVLTAQAINPRKIAPPIIAQKSSLTFFKIVGVLYEDSSWAAPGVSDAEVCECSGEAVLSGVVSEALGLVEVVGQSAEPHALNGQYIIVEKQLAAGDVLKKLDGKPVIASDTDGSRYFKRLRVGNGRVVLESMDSGGDYAPVILGLPGDSGNCLEHVWPVAGVIFELPN